MVNILLGYVCSFLEAIGANIQTMHNNVKRDFGMVVSKKFYDNFKYLLILNRIVGLFPISVTRKGDSYYLEWSWLKVIAGNFFVLLFAALTLTGVVTSYNIEEVYNVRLKGLSALMSTLAEIFALSFTWLIGQVSVSLSFKEFWRYLCYLTKVQDYTGCLADEIVGPVESTTKVPLVIMTVFIFTFSCLGLDIYMWSDIVVPISGTFNFIWQLVPFYFTYVFNMILQINVWLTIYQVTVRMQKLESLLESFINFEAAQMRFTLLGEDERKITRVGNGPRKPTHMCSTLTPHAMKKIIFAYDHISMSCTSLNILYGPSIMIMLINIIACLVITPYILYQQILNAKEYGFLFTQSYWMTCHTIRLLFLIDPCHQSHKQCIRLKRTVIKLAATDLTKDVYKQVKLLLLHVTENKVEFSAVGFTFLNRSLLPTIGSAVFTYLAILFQYKNNT